MCAETLSTPRMEQAQIEAICHGSIRALRAHPRVGYGVPIIVAIEGCGPDPIFEGTMFREHEDVLVMTEIKQGTRFGVPKDERITKSLVTTTQTMMSLRLVTIPTDAIAYSTQYAVRKKTMRDFREALASQFANFKLSQKTGKMSGKEHGRNDDLLITFMMALYWMTRFCVSIKDDYLAFKQNYGADIWAMAQAGALLPPTEADNSESRRSSKRKPNSLPPLLD